MSYHVDKHTQAPTETIQYNMKQPGLATSFQLVRLVGCGLIVTLLWTAETVCEMYTVSPKNM